MEKQIIKILSSVKIIALIGASANKKKDSYIVMNYLQENGYKVIPVNPFYSGKKILGERTFSRMDEIDSLIDMVDVFRPSIKTPSIAKQAVSVGAKILWLQLGITNKNAKDIAKSANIKFIENKCIKLEHQRLLSKKL